MKQIKVKRFNAYDINNKQYYKDLGISDVDIFEYDKAVLNDKGFISPIQDYAKTYLGPIKPLNEDLEEAIKYELDDVEKQALKMLKSSRDKAEDLYDSCKRKYNRYNDLLIRSIFPDKQFYKGEHWKCDLSPLGYCIYEYTVNGSFCIFCGEPEERK